MVTSCSLATDECITCSEGKVSTSDLSESPQVNATQKNELFQATFADFFWNHCTKTYMKFFLLMNFQDMQWLSDGLLRRFVSKTANFFKNSKN